MSEPADIHDLQQFVRDNQVEWGVHSIVEKVRGERVPLGYELEISAVSDSTSQCSRPDSPASAQLFCGLKTLVEALVPHTLDGTRIDVLTFDHSVHLEPRQRFRPRVLLKLQIIHVSSMGSRRKAILRARWLLFRLHLVQ